ncbi:50S ribosomal protein L4 ['Crotalaria aegyptiaca' phytoplasma]|uniref:Large ribosomal subunit protein uL4 n=1 Tax=Candidatus Phytoplasma crotalariae TaxID=2982627 RepID=A0ABT9D5C5_9MOLU|nr:50S ribosomal protein L4 ['Crotalaria aegyptiaca' phytoplasma]MDO8059165.1 50S ribosomal protein L4 ['Crotalaria aegyptiaca' phytoplasma]
MLKCNVINIHGQPCDEIILSNKIFGVKLHQQAIYDVINQQRAAKRLGNHKTKNRAEVSGGGRKPWAQKGTGRSRQGTIRSPIWRGGGHAFALQKRDYHFKINAKVRKLAFYSALSWHFKNNTLIILDSLDLKNSKTKEFTKLLTELKINLKHKILIAVPKLTDYLIKSTNNLSQVMLESVTHFSVYQIFQAKYLMITRQAINYLEGKVVNE